MSFAKQGTGKDTFFDFIASLIGRKHTTQVEKISNLYEDQFDPCKVSRKLIIVSEAHRSDSLKQFNALKNQITAKEVRVREVHTKPFHIHNLPSIVLFGQDAQMIPVDADDRRFAIFDVAPDYANDQVYFGKLCPHYENPKVMRAFFQFLLERNVTLKIVVLTYI